jgi:hypothetical protein
VCNVSAPSSRDTVPPALSPSRLDKYDTETGHTGLYDINAESGKCYYTPLPTVSTIDKVGFEHDDGVLVPDSLSLALFLSRSLSNVICGQCGNHTEKVSIKTENQ